MNRALQVALAFATWSCTLAANAPATPTPDELARLATRPPAAGFHEDRFGCYVPNVSTPAASAAPLPPPGPRVAPTTVVTHRGNLTITQSSGQDEPGYHVTRAQYAAQQRNLRNVVAEYRAAANAAQPDGAQPNYIDYVARLPLSIALLRSGDLPAARAEWSTMLRHRVAAAKQQRLDLPSPPAAEVLAQRRLDALAERAVPDWNPGFFDSGAGQHMVRGTELAKKRAYDAAAVEWRTAARCSPEFQPPHLMLGYYAFLKADRRTARSEWVAALEGSNPAPGDMLGITKWQYDAMAALLRFTDGR